ncbi:MAG: RNA polymerase sigma factor, partial [Bacteroidia bacterium]
MDLDDLSEDELIEGCTKANRNCQNILYKKFAPKMMVVCYRYSRNREDAEDTLTEGFMKVFENISKFRKDGSLEGWIRKILVNTAIAKFKSNKQVVVVDFEQYHYLIPSTENIYSIMDAKELMNIIQSLPPAYQMVFNLYSFEG